MSPIEQGWGLLVVLWFQGWRSGIVEALAAFFHYAGSEEGYFILLPLIYWCVDAALGRRVVLFFMMNAWLNSALKEWWARPRPYQVSSQVKPSLVEVGYGIPSGHAQAAVALWGAVARHVRQNWLTWAVIAYTLLTAVSRLVLGVHFPQDVVAGLLIGLALLGLYVWLEPRVSAWLSTQSLPIQIGAVVAVSALMLVAHPILLPVTAQPDVNTVAATVVAIFLGGGIGVALETRYIRFDAGGHWWKRLVRLLIGLAVALGLRFGLGALFTGLQPDLALRVLRYALIGFWMAFGAPWVFVRAKLADITGDRSHASQDVLLEGTA